MSGITFTVPVNVAFQAAILKSTQTIVDDFSI